MWWLTGASFFRYSKSEPLPHLSRGRIACLLSRLLGRGPVAGLNPTPEVIMFPFRFPPHEPNMPLNDRTPAPKSATTATTAVTGITTAQKIHWPCSKLRISCVFIPKMLETVEIGRKIMVTMVKTYIAASCFCLLLSMSSLLYNHLLNICVQSKSRLF